MRLPGPIDADRQERAREALPRFEWHRTFQEALALAGVVLSGHGATVGDAEHLAALVLRLGELPR